ncbi:hypothetical protein [Moraxella atlantae]|uniref:Holin n=1 Tax=Faucicola atlantae TaxID=34059 RepID=A0A378Q3E4_9GAMM|nr:hypothetical protein [Moraxella atlantae]STY95222.1 Uncharacterised protein [Moraxella atlantae]
MGNVWMGLAFAPQIMMAVIGGTVGGMIGISEKASLYGPRLAVLLVMASIVFAGATVDYLMTEHGLRSLFISAAIGMSVGVFSGHLMDALRLASPRLADKLVNRMGDSAIEKLVKKTRGDDDEQR